MEAPIKTSIHQDPYWRRQYLGLYLGGLAEGPHVHTFWEKEVRLYKIHTEWYYHSWYEFLMLHEQCYFKVALKYVMDEGNDVCVDVAF